MVAPNAEEEPSVLGEAKDEVLRALRIEWNYEKRAFQVTSEESMGVQYPERRSFIQRRDEDKQQTDHELRKLLDRFQGFLDNQGAPVLIEDVQELRTRILTKILDIQTPLRWMTAFLGLWQDLVDSIAASGTASSAFTDPVDHCQELAALAGGWKLIGDIARARSTLAKCFEVTRRYLKAPFTEAEPLEDGGSQALRRVAVDAKKLLLECVAFQSSLARYKELLGRHKAPLDVQASISDAFWRLLRKAPFSVELTLLLADSLMKQQQFALVATFLERSSLSGETAELTLIHARALAYAGFYSQSIEVAHSFMDHGKSPIKAVSAYCHQLMKLRACREQADECLRLDQFDKAASGYAECLALVDPADRKQVAVLLFGHANALLGLDQVPAAIDELRKSLKLDPANRIASIRLQTACLLLETEQVKRELARHQPRRSR